MPRTTIAPTDSYTLPLTGYGKYRVAASVDAVLDEQGRPTGDCKVNITYARRFNEKTGKFISRQLRLKERTALEREIAIQVFYRKQNLTDTNINYVATFSTNTNTTNTAGTVVPTMSFAGTTTAANTESFAVPTP
ncbi:MAG: hypothetical protein RJB66_34 [Pseudomonadota bacterium]|jgi:hypothetical protein